MSSSLNHPNQTRMVISDQTDKPNFYLNDELIYKQGGSTSEIDLAQLGTEILIDAGE